MGSQHFTGHNPRHASRQSFSSFARHNRFIARCPCKRFGGKNEVQLIENLFLGRTGQRQDHFEVSVIRHADYSIEETNYSCQPRRFLPAILQSFMVTFFHVSDKSNEIAPSSFELMTPRLENSRGARSIKSEQEEEDDVVV